jgi:hypothetical protein
MNLQLQHVSIDAVLPFSGHSMCRLPPPHHIQQGGCLQLAQTRPNFCSCNCVKRVWALYAFTLIALWQRLLSLNISWDFDVLGEVIRKRGIFTVAVPSEGERRVVDICLTLIRSKPRSTNPSQMSSAGLETGRRRTTAFTGFWNLG